MRPTKLFAIGTLGSFCLLAPAVAAELTGAEIKDLISGKSVYLELTGASVASAPGQGVIYYAPDGTALYKTAKGDMWHGTWKIRDDTLCADWKEAPDNPCSKYDKQSETITVINVATGLIRGKILKTAPGNAEKLAP
jgi:hypothetical protein